MSRTIVQSIDLQDVPSEAISRYITRITDSGITIHPEVLTNTTSIQLDGTGLDIIKNSISVAKYSEVVRIGQVDKTRIEIDYHSFKQKDDEDNNYVYFSDLRDTTGYATFTEDFVGDGSTKIFELQIFVGISAHAYDIVSDDIAVTVDDVTKAFNTDYTVDTVTMGTVTPPIPYSRVRFTTAPAANSTIVVTYRTASDRAKAFTIGGRLGDLGAHSWTVGYQSVASGILSYAEGARTEASGKGSHAQNQDTIAKGNYQTAIGYCNKADTSSLFIIGNGKSQGMRENAFSIDWDGNMLLYIDSLATSGIDQKLHQAIVNCGWDDVIV